MKGEICKRGCCWVPFEGLCARQHKCGCHTDRGAGQRAVRQLNWDLQELRLASMLQTTKERTSAGNREVPA